LFHEKSFLFSSVAAQRISELESRIEKTELGSDLDKLITRLDRHLTGTVMR